MYHAGAVTVSVHEEGAAYVFAALVVTGTSQLAPVENATSVLDVCRFEAPSTIGVWSAHMSRCGMACSTSCMPLKAVVRLEANLTVSACPEDAISAGTTEPEMAGSSSGAAEEAPSKKLTKS